MKFVRTLLILALAIAGGGCGRSARTYGSLEQARSAIADGFIPACLPPSTYEVKDSHDLETFTGHGTFRFAPADFGFLLKRTSPVADGQVLTAEQERLQRSGYSLRKSDSMNSQWIIAISGKGFGEYWLQDVAR